MFTLACTLVGLVGWQLVTARTSICTNEHVKRAHVVSPRGYAFMFHL
jgi:hypothetical protein